MSYKLFASKGTGSSIVEALFALAEVDCEVDYLEYGPTGVGNPELKSVNSLEQIPTLLLPDGNVLTESVAIALHIGDIAPDAGLIPGSSSPERPDFLRWLVFFSAAIYPTFTYGDFPERWVTGDMAGKELVRVTDAHRKELWQQLEKQVSSDQWFLGSMFSALDVYLSVMTHWRPRRAWFQANCPNIYRIACEVDRLSRLEDIWSRNFET